MAVNPAPFGFSAEYRGGELSYDYLISGSVPQAETHADAENRVAELLEEMARGFKKFKPELEKVLPKPITKVWRWH